MPDIHRGALVSLDTSGNFMDQDFMEPRIPDLCKVFPKLVEVIDGSFLSSGPIMHQTTHLEGISIGSHRDLPVQGHLRFAFTGRPWCLLARCP